MKNFFSKEDKNLSISDKEKGEIGETPFNIIQNSEILTKEEVKALEPLKRELRETFIKSKFLELGRKWKYLF